MDTSRISMWLKTDHIMIPGETRTLCGLSPTYRFSGSYEKQYVFPSAREKYTRLSLYKWNYETFPICENCKLILYFDKNISYL